MPLDDADFQEDASLIGADEHRHRIVLNEMTNRKTERVEHRFVPDTMTVGAIQDDRFQVHATSLLAASLATYAPR